MVYINDGHINYEYNVQYQLEILMIYLIFLCFFLEVMHNFIPERSFEYKDLLGNFIGIVIGAIAIIFFKKYENNKN